MSYLLQHATRRPSCSPLATWRRVDERTLLNRPDFDGGAFVRVFVEDTSGRRVRRRIPEPRLRLRIGDCDERDLPRVRRRRRRVDGRTRSTRSTPCSARCTASGTPSRPRPTYTRSESARGPTSERRRDALPEASTERGGSPQWVAAATARTRSPNSAGGFAWAVDDWTRLRRFLDPRLGGRQLLRRRVEADA